MAGYVRQQTKRSKGGSFNKGVFVVRQSDGTFAIPGSGTDPLGGTYGDVHELGSSTKTDWPRDDSGIWGLKWSIVESLVMWLNLWNKLAPIKTTSSKTEEIVLEDDTQLEGGDASGSGDDDAPYMCFAHTRKVVAGDTEKPVLVFVGQLKRAGGSSSESGKTTLLPFEANAVDGKGFIPDFGSDAVLGSVTFTALSGNNRMGYWISAV